MNALIKKEIIIGNNAISKYMKTRDIKYHLSWDSLMPVVCKILKDNKYHLLMSTGVVSIYPNLNMDEFVAHDHSKSYLKNVWLVVVEYCMQLNKKKNKR